MDEMAKAGSLMKAGCYRCLQESLAIYQRLAAMQRPPAGAEKGAFDAAILVAVREKELGIPADESMERALRLASQPASQALRLASQPASPADSLAQGNPGPLAVVEAARLVVGELSGYDPEQRAQLTGRGRPPIGLTNPVRRALDEALETELATVYVGLTIDCESSLLVETVDLPALMTLYDGVPLMQFRLSRCGRPAIAPRLAALRAGDPRWADTLFWEARAALTGSAATGIDFPRALALFNEGRAAFPGSLAMTMSWANTNMSAEEFESSLAGFDEVLAKFPTHRDALIGRATALSYLMRHTEAVEATSSVIDLGTWHIGDAYYWRAWNRYHLKEYEAAWADAEHAIKGLSNTRVYTLAGLIAYARKEVPTAIQRFDRAYEIDSSNCDATWMSGLASIDLNELAVAAPKFTRAMSCFVKSAAALREDAQRIDGTIARRGTPATARETRQRERALRDAENADERSAQSAFNAAQCLARTGDKAQALTHVEVAAQHPRMREKALALKAAIEKLPDP
jgi:tetratricopeptide (TPR) repeat protein